MTVEPSADTCVSDEFVDEYAMSSSGLVDTSFRPSGSIWIQPDPLNDGLR